MRKKGVLVASGMALALTACGGGGESVGVATGASGEVSSLTGRTVIDYSIEGVTFTNEFLYGQLITQDGVAYRTGSVTETADAFSGSFASDGLACASWKDLAAVHAPGSTATAALFDESYVCLFFYDSGSGNWFVLDIANSGSVSGKYEFTAAGSGGNGFVGLATSPDALLTGTHFSSSQRSAYQIGSGGLTGSEFGDTKAALVTGSSVARSSKGEGLAGLEDIRSALESATSEK